MGGHGLLDFLMQLGRERESLPSPLTRKPLGERGTHLFLRGPVIMAGVSALGCTPPQVRAHSCGSAARCGEGCRADEPTVSTWLPLGISGKVWTLWSERCTQMQMFALRSQSLSDPPPPPAESRAVENQDSGTCQAQASLLDVGGTLGSQPSPAFAFFRPTRCCSVGGSSPPRRRAAGDLCPRSSGQPHSARRSCCGSRRWPPAAPW